MTKFLFNCLFFIAIASFANAQQSKLSIGDRIPSYTTELQNANGGNITLQSAMGNNGLLIMFSCNTCPFVIKNQQVTNKTMLYARNNSIGMVVVNANEAKRNDDDSYTAMKKYAVAQHYSVPYVLDADSKLADLFGANHTPEIFLFNNKGVLVYKGAMNDNPGSPDDAKTSFIHNAIDALMSGKPIDPNVTKSIGCSIKRKS